ncbi:MAG: hypothetical protein ACRELV_01070 [Longimicrobiales bacterium]
MRRATRTGLACLTILALAPAVLAAQAPDNADAREIAAFTLEDTALENWAVALSSMNAAVAADPSLAESIELEADATLDDMVTAIESRDVLRGAIEDAGMDVREYTLFTIALTQALFAEAIVSQGLAPEIPEGVNPANVEFVERNKARIEALVRAGAAEEDGSGN